MNYTASDAAAGWKRSKQMRDSRTKSSFYTRGFTTFVLAAAFLVLAVTGAVLYITPRGRVANWTDWSLLGLDKQQWSSVHITIATLFLLAAALHLFLIGKLFWATSA